MKHLAVHLCAFVAIVFLVNPSPASALEDMISIGDLSVDRTEVSIASFAVFADDTGFVSAAEQAGGGLVYANGWEQMSGWTWRQPFGDRADDRLPAVHLTFDEAQTYCRWRGARLPTDEEWERVAYTEARKNPPAPFTRSTTYSYPTGDEPAGANCLNECGPTPAVDYSARLNQGIGPAPVGTTRPGVNGLYDMGANVWEWTNIDDQNSGGTRGGSWWYGASQMRRTHRATKPRDMSVVYIGFRCVR